MTGKGGGGGRGHNPDRSRDKLYCVPRLQEERPASPTGAGVNSRRPLQGKETALGGAAAVEVECPDKRCVPGGTNESATLQD
jgi:hypothetical protein